MFYVMKRVAAVILLIVLSLSICACGDAQDYVTTSNNGSLHIERHYQDTDELFCVRETNLNTGVTIVTYFYWQHDAHGRRTLSRTECVTIDRTGNVIDTVSIPVE